MADVEHLADGAGFLGECHQRAHHVADVGEAAQLPAVTVHRQRLAAQGLPHERRDDHAVLAGLARADRIEEPDDHHRQAAFLVVGQRQELVDRLAAGIGPAMLVGRAHHQVRVLAEREVGALAVDLRRRRDHHQPLLLAGLAQHDLGAVDVGLDRGHRLLDDLADPDRGREVEHHIGAIHEFGDERLVAHRADGVAEPRLPLEVRDVGHRAGREVVDHLDVVTSAQQGVCQV